MDITTKKLNYELYERGLYGNKLRTWDSLDSYGKSGYSGTVSIRYKGANGGGFCAYNVSDVDSKISEFVSIGADTNLFALNESAPDDKLLIQGEFTHTSNGYSLFYSLDKGKMRNCLLNGTSETGLKAKLIMQHFLNPNSFNDIMELIELYPNHVIEFSTYNFCLGDCHNRNTIIWEVRKY